MHIDLPNLGGLIPRDAEKAIATLRAELERAHVAIGGVQKSVANPGPITATQLKQIRDALQVNGTAPLNVAFLVGGGIGPTGGVAANALRVGTHSQRITAPIPPNNDVPFFEIDRAALYVTISGAWVWVGSLPYMEGLSTGARPTDLGVNDAGFLYFDIATGLTEQWSGNIWHFHSGLLIAPTLAGRPPAFVGIDGGHLFTASAMGYQTWELDFGTGTWVLLAGWGEPMRGTINPDQKPTVSLGINDVGFMFYATDFDRVYRWTGVAWADAPGQPLRGEIVLIDANMPAPGVGWAQCIGGATNRSTPAGGIAAYTPPNIPNQTFARIVTGGTGATGGTLVTGNESADTNYVVVLGAGSSIPATPHTHTLLPPFFELQAWVRL